MKWRRRLLRRQRKAAAKRGLRMYRAMRILRAVYAEPLSRVLYSAGRSIGKTLALDDAAERARARGWYQVMRLRRDEATIDPSPRRG